MITVRTTSPDSDRIAAFPAYADALLRDVVDEGRRFGENYMSSIVPRGRTGRLGAAVVSSIYSIDPSHHIGSVGVDQRIAPHALAVDRGTGVDGPYRSSVVVRRPPRRIIGGGGGYGRREGASGFAHTGRKVGAMLFFKNGEEPRFRTQVKFRPSNKIEQNKNFSGRTHDAMVDWTRIRSGVLAGQLALYFVNPADR